MREFSNLESHACWTPSHIRDLSADTRDTIGRRAAEDKTATLKALHGYRWNTRISSRPAIGSLGTSDSTLDFFSVRESVPDLLEIRAHVSPTSVSS